MSASAGKKMLLNFLISKKLIQSEFDKFGDEDDLRKFYHTSSKGYSRSREELREFEGLANYVRLAADNKTHFPPYSWKEYLDQHTEALEYARQYSIQPSQKLLETALIHEGFAQHFLHEKKQRGRESF
jgi:hypothetical protein